MTLPLSEARNNNELVTLAGSQVLRWIDELRGASDILEQVAVIRGKISSIRKEPSSAENKKKIRQAYEELDRLQYVPDYLCVIMDSKKDYRRACEGFFINGIKYYRLLGTNGGIKCSTIVFMSERYIDEIRKRIDNGRNKNIPIIPAKLEAYKALSCSASTPVSIPKKILVVPDCEVTTHADVIYLSDDNEGEPTMERKENEEIKLDASDGFGLMTSALADRWAEELGLSYRPGGVNTRFSFEKGMIFCFDFVEFAEKVAHNYIVKDAWGDEVDIRDVELIFTTSMLKLYDSYSSCEDYLRNCLENHYQFAVTKIAPPELESRRNLNYQFIQSYDLDEADVDELLKDTIDDIRGILGADWSKAILYLKGGGLNEAAVSTLRNDWVKAMMIEPTLFESNYIKRSIHALIKKRIDDAKIGVVSVHGNYSIISGDPYSLCQSIFGLPVTGILKAGEIYNEYWVGYNPEALVCFRAPMTCHNNIKKVAVNTSDEAKYWYRYIKTCTILNSWDTIGAALNGADYDGDLIFLTDNPVLVNKHRYTDTLMCVQRKGAKIIPTEEDIIASNIASFGDEIGAITNRITSMFDIQAGFPKDSEEYKILSYRIQCGQQYQQNAIDKAKGIIAKPMPREWYDPHSIPSIKDPDAKALCSSILADKKPYFMIYIYPDLRKKFNKYTKNAESKAIRLFGKSINEMINEDIGALTDEEKKFLYWFIIFLPVSTNKCVVNIICNRIEKEFDGYLKELKGKDTFNYELIKSSDKYSARQYKEMSACVRSYLNALDEYSRYCYNHRTSEEDKDAFYSMTEETFRRECLSICSSERIIVNILTDLYTKNNVGAKLLWQGYSDFIIDNLLANTGGMIKYLTRDGTGKVSYKGEHYRICEKNIKDEVL